MRARFASSRRPATRPARPPASARRQRGAAIISALLVVTLSAILVAGVLWRQQVQIRRIQNQRLMSQALWVSRGAVDWTRLILRSEADTAPTVTYLGGIWAVPIAKTRLSDFLGKVSEADAAEGAQTYLSGSIEDAQARFNLRNLISVPAPGLLQIDQTEAAIFARLLALLGLDGGLAKTVAIRMRASLLQSATRFQTPLSNRLGSAARAPQPGSAAAGNNATDQAGLQDEGSSSSIDAEPLQFTSADSLLNVPGFTPEMVARLRPFVTVLPTQTPVNMNTAPAEVIAAMVPGMSLSSAQSLVSRRQSAFFRNTSDVQLALQGAGALAPGLDISQLPMDVTTSYFLVHGRVQYERAEVDRTTLIYRDPLTHTTRVVRVRDQL
ncbi:general secretion pathway protein GspK [Trinickia dabaoshanensis]|uniref:General secretion pathway protein GspK n=1 Tax=Trinickia dabaoshanensis TaxID=564714 RepID=A0A2N7W022_9BURK|nr:type II secretion system minor pseudopilin GspK [Trinickia dabaoshanensis]PMS22758.1 general secretion pathway protein GspK [Trinickia dabaoshanensis]